MNTTIQKEKIINVLRSEQGLIDGTLSSSKHRICGRTGHCAVGALLFAAGVPNRVLGRMEDDADAVSTRFGDLLRYEYGLSEDHTLDLMRVNDSVEEKCEVLPGAPKEKDFGDDYWKYREAVDQWRDTRAAAAARLNIVIEAVEAL